MDKQELLKLLVSIKNIPESDIEADHVNADKALLKYIDDQEITDAFGRIQKWYI